MIRKIIKYELGSPMGILDNLITIVMLMIFWSAGLYPWMWQFWAFVVCEGLRLGIRTYRTKKGEEIPWP